LRAAARFGGLLRFQGAGASASTGRFGSLGGAMFVHHERDFDLWLMRTP
jgi:hypothetical protein